MAIGRLPGRRGGALIIRQDARLYLASLDPGEELVEELNRERHAWIQVLRGSVALGGNTLFAGDGAAMSDESTLVIGADRPSEVILFDLA